MKNCQFCAEKIAPHALYCKQCNHEQQDKKLLFRRYFSIQVIRFGVMLFCLSVITFLLSINVGELKNAAELFGSSLQLAFGILFIYPFINHVVVANLDDKYFAEIRVPYYLQKIKNASKSMLRTVIVFPLITLLLFSGQVKLSQKRPSLDAFKSYLEKQKRYAVNDIVAESVAPLFTYHIVGNTHSTSIYLGIYDNFYCLDYSGK